MSFFSQTVCTDAEEFTLPSLQKVIDFDGLTQQSLLHDTFRLPLEIKGYYYTTTPVDDTFVTIDTCYETTTVITDIYIYQTCNNDIAGSVVARSGADTTCGINKNFPILNYLFRAGTTYNILIKLDDSDDNGTVSFEIKETILNNTNVDCDTAIEVNSIPFSYRGMSLNTTDTTIQPTCLDQQYHILWYKVQGEGSYLVVGTCDSYTNFDTEIVVIEMDNSTSPSTCNNEICLMQTDDGCGTSGLNAVGRFFADEDRTYYIGIYGYNDNEGQFVLNINYLNDTIPSICSQAIEIQTIPYVFSQELGDEWNVNSIVCGGPIENAKSVYFTYNGTGEKVVISGCNSMYESATSGIGIEIISGCDDEQCALTKESHHTCQDNDYIVETFTPNTIFTIKAYCKTSHCNMTIEFYSADSQHATCESAYVINNENIMEIYTVKELTSSYHGCSDVAIEDIGVWYEFQKSTSGEEEYYMIRAYDESGSKRGMIEFSQGCMSLECDALIYGEATIRMNICDQNSHAADFFSFTSDGEVFATTYFDDTTVSTSIAVSTSCSDCVDYSVDNITIKDAGSYDISVYETYTESVINAKQYRLGIVETTPPKTSLCNNAIEITEDHVTYTVSNHYTFKVSTCSSLTSTNSMIVVSKTCLTEEQDNGTVSILNEFESLKISSITSCDIYGTYVDLVLSEQSDYYVFVAPESLNDDGFFEVEFLFEYEGSSDHYDNDDEGRPTADIVWWMFYGIILYITFIAVLVSVIALIIKAQKTTWL
ncbi:Uncharacterized protein QTN25_001191 [Entamoeba marina]